jgi:arylformamidase
MAPSARIARMISACAEALRWLRATSSPELLVVAGSSAGAHLAVCAAAEPGVSVDGVVAFSGVYDLAPLRGTSVDEALRLSEAEAESLSPVRRAPSMARTLLAVGENETSWFHQLQATYANYLRTHDVEATEQIVLGRNHFDVVFELQDHASPVGGWLNDLRDTPRAPKDR